jgi:uncharacterized lipoprotein YajG
MHRMKTIALIIALAALAACQRPAVPPQDKPPEPKALAHSVQAPLEKARGVQRTLDDAEKQRRAQEERAEKE